MATVTHKAPDTAPLTKDRRLKQWIGYGLRYLVPAGCSALLIIWLFHKVNFHQMMQIIHKEVDFWWIALMMIITMFSHIIRGIRWGLQLDAAGVTGTSKLTLVCSIFGDYAMNLLLPRAGEVWRCIYITHRRRAKFSTVVGTVVGDRTSDMMVVMVLLLLTVIVAGGALSDFLTKYRFGKEIVDFAENPWLWGILALVVTVTWTVFHVFRNYKFLDETKGALDRVWDGFKVLFTLPQQGEFWTLTLGIWGCYFLETYVCFYAFPFTRELIHHPGYAYGLLPGLVVFVFGTFSMAIPSNGGLGPWNIAVMFALSLYGVSREDGTAFSMVMWSCQALMLVILGVFTLIVVMTQHRAEKKEIALATKQSVHPK